mmetsp:Transcript_5388/g.12331  ORF Transcript_5388/g.12331 Transcript_5388/m.12331 type:complete len:263 (+) Transcript_5388:1069-1857(+)
MVGQVDSGHSVHHAVLSHQPRLAVGADHELDRFVVPAVAGVSVSVIDLLRALGSAGGASRVHAEHNATALQNLHGIGHSRELQKSFVRGCPNVSVVSRKVTKAGGLALVGSSEFCNAIEVGLECRYREDLSRRGIDQWDPVEASPAGHHGVPVNARIVDAIGVPFGFGNPTRVEHVFVGRHAQGDLLPSQGFRWQFAVGNLVSVLAGGVEKRSTALDLNRSDTAVDIAIGVAAKRSNQGFVVGKLKIITDVDDDTVPNIEVS